MLGEGRTKMKKLGQALPKAAFASPILLFCFLSVALASRDLSTSKQHSPTQTSNGVITFRLTMSDGRFIQVSQRDGEMMTTGPHGGEKLGITPHILDNGSVGLDFFRVTKILKKGVVVGGSAAGIGSMELSSAHPQMAPIDLVYSVELVGVSRVERGSDVRIDRGPDPCPCCVTCGGYETCGDGVVLSCGSCTCQ